MKEKYNINVVKNKSTTYILPYLASQVDILFRKNLLNSYLSFEEEDGIFCVMYKWSSDQNFLKYEDYLMNHQLYLGHADFGEVVVYKFRVSVNMKQAINRFKKADYIFFSDKHKDYILSYLEKNNFKHISKVKDVMSPNSEVISDPPDMFKETLCNHVKEIVIHRDDFKD